MSNNASDAGSTPPPSAEDAVELLRADHARLRELFGEYAMLAGAGDTDLSAADRQGLLARLSTLLRAHLLIEQELFYPALEALLPAQRVQRSVREHEALQARLREVAAAQPQNEGFDACVAALAEAVHEHLRDEELELFPAAQRLDLDLNALGTRMALRRGALLSELGVD